MGNKDIWSDQMLTSIGWLRLAPGVAAWLLYAFFAPFALTTGALPAFADVLILVDKSTQQMSVSVDPSARPSDLNSRI